MVPKSFVPVLSWPVFSTIEFFDGSIFHATQCTHVFEGASGSSTITVSEVVPSGTSEKSSGGETFSPSQVYFAGIFPPASNSALVIFIMDGKLFWFSSFLEVSCLTHPALKRIIKIKTNKEKNALFLGEKSI